MEQWGSMGQQGRGREELRGEAHGIQVVSGKSAIRKHSQQPNPGRIP